MTRELISTISKFFPAVTAYANVKGNLNAETLLPPHLFVRFVWSNQHPGVALNNDPLQIIELKQLYTSYGFDWTQDPLLPQGLT